MAGEVAAFASVSDSWIKDKDKLHVCHSEHGHHAKQGDKAANGVLRRPPLHEGLPCERITGSNFLVGKQATESSV